MIDRLLEIGKCYGVEVNVEKTEIMRISRQPSPVWILRDQKLENVEYFNFLRSLATTDARCTREIRYRIAIKKQR
jgi:hypothetical protein